MAEVNNIKQFAALTALALFLGLFCLNLTNFSIQGTVDPLQLHSAVDQSQYGIFNDQVVSVPPVDAQVLGDMITLPNGHLKQIYVDLATQRLTAFDNNQKVFDYLISSGKWDRTPNGTFYIWTKIKSQRMKGGSKEMGTYYDLPNVPNILFFYNDATKKELGFSIHGTYWHNNFGVPMSHGCINMSTPDSLQVFNWADVGTSITITGKYSPVISKK